MGANDQPEAARAIAPGLLQAFSTGIQRVILLRNGARLGDLPSAGSNPATSRDNKVADARLALGRFPRLWAINNTDYNNTMNSWQSLAPSDQLTGDNLAPLTAAILNARQPRLATEVANEYLPVDLPPGGTVGLRGTVGGDDLASVQRALGALGLMSPEAVQSGDWGSTLKAISNFKSQIAGGTLGWMAIHADEDDSGGDRFAGRTYGPFFGSTDALLSAFIPKGAPLDSNFVHVHFSPDAVDGEGGNNALLMHGLRGAFYESSWIVIGVSGYTSGTGDTHQQQEDNNKRHLNYISMADIERILGKIGRLKTDIKRITLSAHSRGANALIYTLGGLPIAGATGLGKPSIDTSKVEQVTVFDHVAAEIGTAVRAAGLQGKTRIYLATEDGNPTGLPVVELRSPQIADRLLAKDCFRAIAYVRFIQDAIRRGILSPPQDKMSLANLLLNGSPQMPDRGKFTSQNLPGFCAAHVAQGNMQKILDEKIGLRDYVYDNNIPRFAGKQDVAVDRHHYFVCEVAHELVLP